LAGEVVPQNGQTRAFFSGFHCASAPHAGHENFFCAMASGMIYVGQRVPPVSKF